MTETDATKRPLEMPTHFLPQLERSRVYLMMKDMLKNIILHLPKDHLKQMKIFASRHLYTIEATRLMLLVEPELDIGPGMTPGEFPAEYLSRFIQSGFSDLRIKPVFVPLSSTLNCVTHYKLKGHALCNWFISSRNLSAQHHDKYVPGCIDPILMSEITKTFTESEPVPQVGWLMFDHPCTLREARCLQQDAVLPTVTLVMMKTPPVAAKAVSNHTPPRNFFQQDFEGLKYAYKATAKEVHITPEDSLDSITIKCFNAVRAFNEGHQGAKQGLNVTGAPSVYRVLLLGPRGSGRSTQALALAKHFGLVFLHFDAIFNEAAAKDDETGEKIRKYKTSITLRGEVVKKRIAKKDCIDHGWVMVGYPTNGNDFELLDAMLTPPNRVIFLNMDEETCRERCRNVGFDMCSGKPAPMGSGPWVVKHPDHNEVRRDYEWDLYFTEQLAELRASAGLSAIEIDATEAFDKVQVKVQAAVIAAPHFDIEYCSQLRSDNICAD